MENRTIVLVDDDRGLRVLLRSVLTKAGWVVAGEADDGRRGAELVVALRPSVALMDLQLPELCGIGATRAIHDATPEVDVVVLTGTEDGTVFDALEAGASGYLVKGLYPSDIVVGIDKARTGRSPISPIIARMILDAFQGTLPAPASELTAIELEILGLLVEGVPVVRIAERLGIGVDAAGRHVRTILSKLAVAASARSTS